VVLFLGVSWLVGRGDDGASGSSGAQAVGTTAAPTTSPAPRPTATTKPPPPAVKGVVLTLRASGGSSWVSVTASDGNQLYQGILTDGTTREFRDAKQLSVRFGNSPAVRVVQNGRDMGAPRCDRQVCTIAFGSTAAG
jgi:cytoskeleton protein RodZ